MLQESNTILLNKKLLPFIIFLLNNFIKSILYSILISHSLGLNLLVIKTSYQLFSKNINIGIYILNFYVIYLSLLGKILLNKIS